MRRTSLALVCALICSAVLEGTAFAQSDWQRFRGEYPYHLQTIALGEASPTGRTLIVAEPPPSVTLRELQQTWPREFAAATIQRHRIGVDGWVADVVTRLPPQSEDATAELVRQLSGYLFGTSYKSYALQIGAKKAAPADNLDLSVSTTQLATWFGLHPQERSGAGQALDVFLGLALLVTFMAAIATRRRKWVLRAVATIAVVMIRSWVGQPPVPDVLFVERHTSRAPESLADVMNRSGGVYDSAQRGVVVFVMPRSASLNTYDAQLREFVLDTDSIVGAVATATAVAIVGRERVVPVDVMPPLRVETLLQLASVRSTELAQSYERNNLVAGRFDRVRHRDWAPIYLSAELKDTEYGSLLNITDQLLKSWSQHGEVRYANFDYAVPRSYPFPVRLSSHANTSTVTFNWNTKGVGYVDETGGYKLLGFARTGSLPVDYLGERDARLRSAEDTAYEYFAASRDPNLARVVQYAGAYQIFRAFDVKATNPYTVPADSLDRATLEALAADVIDTAKSDEAAQFAERVARTPRGQELAESFRSNVVALRQLHDRYGTRGDADLAKALIEPREWGARARQSGSDYDREVLELAFSLMDDQIVKALGGTSMHQAALQMYLHGSRGGEANWIHTPAVVVSWTTGEDAAQITGGHSLSSKVTRYAIDDTLPAGDIRVVDGADARTIYYSTTDKARIHATVRRAGRAQEQNPDVLRQTLRQDLQLAQPRLGPVPQVLRLGDTVAERGLGAHAGVRVHTRTWSHQQTVLPHHKAALEELHRPGRLAVLVERKNDGVVLTVHGESSSIVAPDTASAIDAFVIRTRAHGATSQAVDVTFTNFNPEQARGFIQSAQLHAPAARRAQINAVVDMKGRPATVARVRATEWDVAAAKIETRALNANGDVAHTLAIPAKRAGSPLRLVVEATAEAASRVRALMSDFLRSVRSSGSAEELLIAFREFVTQLKAIPGVKTVRPIEVHEAGDVFFVRHFTQEAGHATD